MSRLFSVLAFLAVGCAPSAQVAPSEAPPSAAAAASEHSSATHVGRDHASATPDAIVDADGDLTDVERAVKARVQVGGVHVVRLWAPWCGNSRAELEAGLYESIEAHPDVTFSFVTVWNDARDGAAMLARYGIAPSDQVTVAAQPDRGPSADRDLRRTTFLGVPISWTPTTLVYNRGGKLAYAFAYGEVSPTLLATAIADARNAWHHD